MAIKQDQFEALQREVQELRAFRDLVFRGDRFTFIRPVDFDSARFGETVVKADSGLNLGTATTQKVGFYGVTPVDQPATVSDPSGGSTVDSEARTAITALIDRLQELGIIA